MDYQVSIDDNDLPEELFVDEQPILSAIAAALSSTNVTICTDCLTVTCSQVRRISNRYL